MNDATPFRGLSTQEVEASRQEHGQNLLTPPKKESLFSQFLGKFADPIIRILLLALLLSFGVACYEYFTGAQGVAVFFEPLGIFVAILLATCVGFGFEISAHKKFELLNQVNDEDLVKVLRDQAMTEVPKKDIVVGDIVFLNTGDEVPADGELLEAMSLQINESALTGEPVIKKSTQKEDFESEATYPTNHALKGTTVVDGHGILRILKVGDSTEYGQVHEGAQIKSDIVTPLNQQLHRLASLVTWASYTLATLIIVGRLLLYFNGEHSTDWMATGQYILHTLMIAVTLIVVAVPEGLPMSVTLSLALSMKKMLQTQNLVRKMHACETMGATTVICTDKTGTLTQNQMSVYETQFYGLPEGRLTGETLSQNPQKAEIAHLIAEGMAVNSTAFLEEKEGQKTKVLGNPTEGALLLWLSNQGLSYEKWRQAPKVLEQLTFSTERKYMASLVFSPQLGKNILYLKGAPEIIFAHCQQVRTPEGSAPCSEYKTQVEEQLLAYQNQAMRTLGFAYKEIDPESEQVLFADGRLQLQDLTFLGIAAIADPVRSDVPEAIQDCLKAGISVKIVTGDTPATAREIGRQISLWLPEDGPQNILTGPEFAALSDDEILERLDALKIMCRARPMDKQRLVALLQQKGHVVAVTGDGTNDAPALNRAQVGLSMGDGTSVAKEASAITILDNSFHSISRAVMWGRSLYQNIQRFILFQMTINVTACLIVLLGAFLGTQSPLTVTQMLWVNLIMDTFAALALASLPPNKEVMLAAPRKASAHIITPAMGRGILGIGLSFVVALLALLQYFKHYDVSSLSQFSWREFSRALISFDYPEGDNLLSSYELTVFFSTFVFLQFWNMFNAKAFLSGKSAFAGLFPGAKSFLLVALLILAGQYLIVSFGGTMFKVIPLSWADWGWILLSTSLVLWIGEALRLLTHLGKKAS